MCGEDIDGALSPEDACDPHSLPHEDLAVKPPETAAVGEGDQPDLFTHKTLQFGSVWLCCDLCDGVEREDGEAGAAEGEDETGTAGVDTLVPATQLSNSTLSTLCYSLTL